MSAPSCKSAQVAFGLRRGVADHVDNRVIRFVRERSLEACVIVAIAAYAMYFARNAILVLPAVKHGHLRTAGVQMLKNPLADEPGAADDQNPHGHTFANAGSDVPIPSSSALAAGGIFA